MRAVIITNGNKPSKELAAKAIETADMVYCCDGAADWAKAIGINISILLGDMDSIKKETLEYYSRTSIDIIKLQREKDMTDTQYAADLATENGATEVTIIGAIGSRLDHTLANIHVLERLFKKGVNAKIIDDKNTIYIAGEGESIINGKVGSCVSILPVKGSVFIEKTEGLYYPIENRSLYVEQPLGVSNVFTEEKAVLQIKTGEAFIIISKD